jgi:periplasmic divalent cation tolerance protein
VTRAADRAVEDAGDAAIVLVACPDEPTATSIARALVEEGLAACVNVSGEVRSIYRWRGSVEAAPAPRRGGQARGHPQGAHAARVVARPPDAGPAGSVRPVRSEAGKPGLAAGMPMGDSARNQSQRA